MALLKGPISSYLILLIAAVNLFWSSADSETYGLDGNGWTNGGMDVMINWMEMDGEMDAAQPGRPRNQAGDT